MELQIGRWLSEQQEAIFSIAQKHQRTVVVSQTNTGKTTLVYALVKMGYKVLLVSPYRGITDQQKAKAQEEFGDAAKVVSADETKEDIEFSLRNRNFVVSTWDKLKRCVDTVAQAGFDYIVVDEVHELTNAIRYRRGMIRVIYSAIEQAAAVSGTRVIGLTATLSSAALECDGWHVVRVRATDAQKYHFLIHEYAGRDAVAENAVVRWLDREKPTVLFYNNKLGLRRIRAEAIVKGYAPESIHIVTAEEKEKNEAYKSIVETERLPENCKLLLCTAVLATGVNIQDENLQIALVNPESTDFSFQSAGRIRSDQSVKVEVWHRRNKNTATQPFTCENFYNNLLHGAVKRAVRYNAGRKPRIVNALRAGRSKYSGLKKHYLIERNGVWIIDHAEIVADAHNHGTIRMRRNIDDFYRHIESTGATVELVETVVVEQDNRPPHAQEDALAEGKELFFSTAKENPNWIASAFYVCSKDAQFRKLLNQYYTVDTEQGERLVEKSRRFSKQSIFSESYFIEIMRDALALSYTRIPAISAFRIAAASRTGELKRSVFRTLRHLLGVHIYRENPYTLTPPEREEFGAIANAIDTLQGRVIASANVLQELNALLPINRRAKNDKEAQGILTDFFGESERQRANGKRERVYNCTTRVELCHVLESVGVSTTLLVQQISTAIAAQEATQAVYEAQEAQREEEEEREAIRIEQAVSMPVDVSPDIFTDRRRPLPAAAKAGVPAAAA